MKYDKQEFIKQIAEHEGLKLEVYQDHLGIDTIGIGRNLEDRGITDEELEQLNLTIEAVYATGITKEVAYTLADNDIQIVVDELCSYFPIVNDFDGTRQRVLVDMGFNMGIPRLRKFKNMWAALGSEDFTTASVEMLDSRWAGQVGNRANRLSEAMKSGEWDAS
tara:strand:- start:110 stop:601 length:492 start_codon:yes stop_codon:yes gene_type:complete